MPPGPYSSCWWPSLEGTCPEGKVKRRSMLQGTAEPSPHAAETLQLLLQVREAIFGLRREMLVEHGLGAYHR